MKTTCAALICFLALICGGLSGVQANRSLFATLQAPCTSGSDTNTTGDLFVLSAKTAILNMTGNTGSLQLNGLAPTTTWFADKPARRGGMIDTTEFLGASFLQNGKWIDNPNVALYSSNEGPSSDDDTVVSIALMSNPSLMNTTEGTSVLFPVVSVLPDSGNSVGEYYSSRAKQGINKGPHFMNSTMSSSTITTNVALFVDPYYCGCGCGGSCGCGWHDTFCLH